MLEKNAGRIVIIGSWLTSTQFPRPPPIAHQRELYTLTRALSAEIDRQRYPNVLVNEERV